MENKIEFNLELYNSGEYDVVTREGKPVKIAGVNEEAYKLHQVIGWLNGACQWWAINGTYAEPLINENDLFLIPKKKIIKGWANVYSGHNSLFIYKTKEKAIESRLSDSIGLVYIETELIPTK